MKRQRWAMAAMLLLSIAVTLAIAWVLTIKPSLEETDNLTRHRDKLRQELQDIKIRAEQSRSDI